MRRIRSICASAALRISAADTATPARDTGTPAAEDLVSAAADISTAAAATAAGAHRGDRRRSEVAATLESMEDEAVDADLVTS